MLKKILKGSAVSLVVTMALSGVSVAQGNSNGASHEMSAANQIEPSYGNIDAFYGSLDAFWGSLDAFDGPVNAQYGNIDAFYGNLDAFYGNLDAFWGSLDAFYGNLDAFYGSLDAFYGNLDAFYEDLDSSNRTDRLSSRNIRAVFAQAEESFANAVELQTGVSFTEAVTHPLLAKYGVEDDFSGIQNLSRADYTSMLLELHDGVMSYTGLDHYDHWMNTVNWSPKLSQSAGGGAGVKVGLLDFSVLGDSDIIGRIEETGGYVVSGNLHGAAVASLIGASHDGKNVMGVAPDVSYSLFNPFDETHTASYRDAGRGIKTLASQGAHIINLSLGESDSVVNWFWNLALNNPFDRTNPQSIVFVKAAGNNGFTQEKDVSWLFEPTIDSLLLVGSVDANGNISRFSNRPGEACFKLPFSSCKEENKLKYHFLVAPGELVLVSDDANGVTRMSGTSFSAPLVTGAVALLHSRWNWLQDYAAESTDIILRSATDLGEPGVDGVYGWGLLNIEASQQPLDPNRLVVETARGHVSVNELGGLTSNTLSQLGPDSTVTAFELIGDTYRDFAVDVSALSAPLAAGAASTKTTSEEYLSQRLATPLATNPSPQSSSKSSKKAKRKSRKKNRNFSSFTNAGALGTVTAGNLESTWSASFSAMPRDPNEVIPADAVGFQMNTVMTNNANGLTLMFGEGQGALAFSGGSEFGMIADRDIRMGGANPLLGLASGGFYSGAAFPLSKNFSVSFGFTKDTDRHEYIDPETGEIRDIFMDVDDYQASAMNFDFRYSLSDAININGSYTQLHEATGLLGGQGSGVFSLGGGVTTDAMTVATDADLGSGFTFSASATTGKTRAADFNNSILSVEKGGITSTAFQIAASKHGLLSDTDRMRVSFAQPLHLETGTLGITTMQVVDRSNGARNFVTDQIALTSSKRRFVSEILYATSVMDDKASISAFGQVELNNMDFGEPQTAITGGGRFNYFF